MIVCMYNLGGFLCCCNFICELLETVSSSGREKEGEITNFELMKVWDVRELTEIPTEA